MGYVAGDTNSLIFFLLFQCESGTAVNMLYDMLYTKPTKLMMIGPGCSNELEVTAEASPAWNITHVSTRDFGAYHMFLDSLFNSLPSSVVC